MMAALVARMLGRTVRITRMLVRCAVVVARVLIVRGVAVFRRRARCLAVSHAGEGVHRRGHALKGHGQQQQEHDDLSKADRHGAEV